jgi:iron complex outermembrane receptor protein
LSYFYSGAEQLIAWVRMPDSDDNAWKTENLTQVVNQGIELQFEVPLEFTTLKKLRLSYTYINQDKSTSGSESKYSLSYLKHKAVIQLFGNISDHWYYSIINTYKDRNGEFPFYDKEKNSYTGSQKYKSHWLVDAKLSWQKEQWKIFVSCSNILNRNYYSVGNIEMPGLWVKAGVVKKLAL